MKHAIFLWSVMILGIFAGIGMALGVPKADVRTLHDTSVYLEFTSGYCTGTAVGPHTVLTATHCTVEGPLVAINDEPAQSLGLVSDGRDHTQISTDRTFTDIAQIHQRRFAQTETIRYFGNPGDFRDAYRTGTVLGFCKAAVTCLHDLPEIPGMDVAGEQVTLYSVAGFGGDSGAGVFDSEGYLVTSISVIAYLNPEMAPMGSFEMVFTSEQLEGIR